MQLGMLSHDGCQGSDLSFRKLFAVVHRDLPLFQPFPQLPMRPKTQRAYRRTMHAYSLGFGFRPPYQLLGKVLFIRLDRERSATPTDNDL